MSDDKFKLLENITSFFEDLKGMDELINLDELKTMLDRLKDNGHCYEYSNTNLSIDDPFNEYSMICSYMIKLNPSLKKYRIKEDNTKQYCSVNYISRIQKDKEYKNRLVPGVYVTKVKKKTYIIFLVKLSKDEGIASSRLTFNINCWFVGKSSFDCYNEFSREINSKLNETDKYFGTDVIYVNDELKTFRNGFKSFDTLIFHKKAEVLEFIDNWVKNIPTYYSYNVNPKLSILLYGKPGTGKSSFYQALANHLNIQTIDLLNASTFDELTKPSSSKKSYRHFRALCAIDEIDTIAHNREDDTTLENGKIISKLLEFLDNPGTVNIEIDGTFYPVSIVVATTNYIERLDPAVVRDGRFDLKIEMTDLDEEEARELCNIYSLKLEDVYDGKISKNFVINPATLQGLCLKNIDKRLKNE